jgi:transposase-like protein
MRCPICKSANVGKIGKKKYFCRDCSCEFRFEKWGAYVFEYDSEGCIDKKIKVCMNE